MKERIVGQAVLWGIVVMASAFLTGCLSPRAPEGPVHTYRLDRGERAVEQNPAGKKREAQGTLLVNMPRAESGFESPRMMYLSRPFELSYYATNQWADTPARMLVTLLVQSLEQSGTWRTVVPVPTSVKGDYRLDSQGLVLQQEFMQQPSHVRLAVRLQLVALGEQKVVGTKWFEFLEPAASEDAYGGVLAANRAVEHLLDQVTVWVSSCIGDGALSHC